MTPYRKIFVHDYLLDMHIGVYDEERASAQKALVSVDLYIDPDYEPQKDNIEYVLNYECIPQKLRPCC